MERNIYKIGKELFITSDEEIKEGDWTVFISTNEITKVPLGGFKGKVCKKIILTTDPDLIKDGIQSIPDEFLEWFVNNPSCDSVEVEIESKFDVVDGHYHDIWEIIIPKEEPKQESERGINIIHVGKPKQETLEEITEQIQNECHSFVESVPNVNYQDATNTFLFMKLAELTLKLKNYETRS